jgi:hypothetical protein
MNRYIKVEGHDNWFLVLEPNQIEPENLSEDMQERLFRIESNGLHKPDDKGDLLHRLVLSAITTIDYESLANQYGTLLIRPFGSYMLLRDNKITDEVFDTNFPIEDFAEIVICENDEKSEYNWRQYLINRFPNTKIVTINFFDLRTDEEVEKYFSKANIITFSTTFTNLGWFEKLNRFVGKKHKIIGYCHNADNWEKALKINNNVEIVEKLGK